MTFRKLGRLIAQSLRRNWRNLALSSVGIVVGIGTLLLFTALGAGVKSFVLEEIFVVRQLEVVPKSYGVGAMGALLGGEERDGLTDRTVEQLRNLEGVEAVYPKMKLTFPSSVRGGEQLLGRNIVAELVGDGIPPRLVESDALSGELPFRDWGGEVSCSAGADCPSAFSCTDGTCRPDSCSAEDSSACTGAAYCDTEAGTCRMPIPVIVSPRLLEIYNSNLHTALGGAAGGISNLPKLSADQLVGFEFEVIFGRSYLGESAAGSTEPRRMRLVGFSERAIRMGVTMPIGYVERLNDKFRADSHDSGYHSIVVETASNDAVARVANSIRERFDELELSDRYDRARRASLLILIVTLVLNLVGLIILTIAAVNITHTFLMILLDRRREIGLMRALGATRRDIALLVLGESTLVGLVAGTCGLGAGLVGTEVIDYLFHSRILDFPFKPESLFSVQPWMLAAAIGAALLFCWLGALVPALRASNISPAEALTGR